MHLGNWHNLDKKPTDMKNQTQPWKNRLGRTLAKMTAGAAVLAAAPAADAQTMLHRWSFNGDGTDSIGGANATLVGAATFGPSDLQVPGGGPFANYADVNIANTLNTNPSLTVESWFTLNALQDWSKVWMFGQDTSGEPSLSYIGLTPRTGLGGNPPKVDFNPTNANEFNTSGGVNPPALALGVTYQAVAVLDAANNQISLYIDGVLVDTGSMGGFNVTNLAPNKMRIGAGFYYGDQDLNGTINEVRIYGGAVGGLQIAVNAITGPDVVDNIVALNSLVLNVSSNVTVGDLQNTSVTFNTLNYGVIEISNSIDVTYSVEPSGILQVTSDGRIHALAPGSAVVTATRGAVSSSATINVADVPLALAHRYSFSDGDGDVAVNSIDPTWNGEIRNAFIQNNEVVLSGGTFSADPGIPHVDLPNGILTNFNSISVEAWVTANTLENWARLYDFGSSNAGEDMVDSATVSMMLTPRGNGNDLRAEISNPQAITARVGNPLPMGVKSHLVYTIDAVSQVARLYLDGVQIAVTSNVTARPKNLGVTVNNWIGRSQFNDPAFDGTVDEFRIWTRALSGSHVALNAHAGPDEVFNSAAVQTVSVIITNSTMVGGTTQHAAALATYAQASDVPVTGVVTNWTSSDTNVVTVSASGLVTAVGPGSATISATVDGVTGTSSAITISVVQPTISQQPASISKYIGGVATFSVTAGGGQLTYQWKHAGVNIPNATNSTLVVSNLTAASGGQYTVGVTNSAGGVLSDPATLTILTTPWLAHRWSFDDNLDSVRGVACNVRGGAYIDGGQLVLPGGGVRQNCGEINGVDDGTGNGIGLTLNTNASMTFEGWMTVSNLNNWSKGWMFGNPNGGGAQPGLSYVDLTPRAGADGNVPSMSIDSVLAGEVNTRGGANPAQWVAGQLYHVACVYDADIDTMSFYLDGALVDSASMGGRRIDQLNVTEAYLGAAVHWGDQDLTGSFDEFRVYIGALPAYQIAANYQNGPSVVAPGAGLAIAPAASGNVTISWAAGTLQASGSVSGTYTNVPGAVSPYTVPATAPQLFYRVQLQ